jgi:ABC-2 type transport system ATP-binding protein
VDAALEVRGLRKSYGAHVAVAGLDLVIPRGEFHALLGPNGAGKTTTLRIVAGLLAADGGTVRVMGHDVRQSPLQAKRVLAFMPDDPMLYGKLDPMEYLEFVCGLGGVPPDTGRARAEQLVATLGLQDKRAERVEAFSRGMRQKLALAGALIHEPDLLILDEPLTGLDAVAARLVKDLLLERVRAGATVVLTTHILEIAERLAERISIIARGRIIAQGTLEELRRGVDGNATLEDIFLELTRADSQGAAT